MNKKEFIKKYDIHSNWVVIQRMEYDNILFVKECFSKKACENEIIKKYVFSSLDVDSPSIVRTFNKKLILKDQLKKGNYKIINLNDYKDNDEIEKGDKYK